MPVFGIVGLGVGLIGLAWSIVRLVRLVGAEPLLRVPVVAEQTVTISTRGPMQLVIEGPHLTTKFAGLTFSLSDRARGVDIPLATAWLRTRSSGMKRARLSLHRFDIATPGDYILRVGGLDAAESYAECALLLTRPASIALPLAIIAIIVFGALTIGAIVATAIWAGVATSDRENISLAELPEAPASGGRQLRSDRSIVPAWREVRWQPARVRLEIPADWVERRNTATELDLGPADPATAFVKMRLSESPRLSADDMFRAARVQASSRLAAERIIGYSARTLGSADGVLSFENSQGVKEQLTWTAIPPGTKQLLTIWIGGATPTFPQTEPVLGAVFDTIRIE